MLKGLLFDFDGLILDTETPEFISWQEVFQRHGCELRLETWAQYIGIQWNAFDPYAHLAELLGHPIDELGIRSARRARNEELLDAEPICAGIVEHLQAAKRQGIPTAVASSAPHAWVDPHLTRLGLIDDFDAVICAEDAAQAKPAPDLYLAALHALGIDASEAVAFEDSPNGILAAKRAGLYCVAVPNLITAQLDLSKADLLVASLLDLPLEQLLTINPDYS